MIKPDVVIVGGGWAGLSAGVELSSQGAKVLLLERRPVLGGRASSVTDPRTKESIDNGQHLFTGCYGHTLEFLRRIGTAEQVRFQDRLSIPYAEPGGRTCLLRTYPLPAPWHLAAGLLAFPRLTAAEKTRVFRAMLHLRSGREDGRVTVRQWLRQEGLADGPAQRYFFEPLTLATLNASSRIASLALLKRVLDLAFFSGSRFSRLGHAVKGLSRMAAEPARRYITERQGMVRTLQGVRSIKTGGHAVTGLQLSDGRKVDAPMVILAVPPLALVRVLPPAWVGKGGPLSFLPALRSRPICSIHLWVDQVLFPGEWMSLTGTTLQWVFDKRKMFRPGEGTYLSATISDAAALMPKSHEEILRIALRDLRKVFPTVRFRDPVRFRVIKEPFATLSAAPEVQQLRPELRTPSRNVFLAGDWVRTGLPATLESAVLSGCLSAQLASQR